MELHPPFAFLSSLEIAAIRIWFRPCDKWRISLLSPRFSTLPGSRWEIFEVVCGEVNVPTCQTGFAINENRFPIAVLCRNTFALRVRSS